MSQAPNHLNTTGATDGQTSNKASKKLVSNKNIESLNKKLDDMNFC